MLRLLVVAAITSLALPTGRLAAAGDTEFFESKIRPILVDHCYACHSEEADERSGDLLLDRSSGWLDGGSRGAAVTPRDVDASLLIRAVHYTDEALQMPPDYQLETGDVRLLEEWIRRGAPGPAEELGKTEFSRLGDQAYLFEQAEDHWAFQPVRPVEPPAAGDPAWNKGAIDRFVFAELAQHGLAPSPSADARTLVRRLTYDLTGLPPTFEQVERFIAAAARDRQGAIVEAVDRLIKSPAFGEHLGRLWLDVARYADTDSFYRPDTRTPHYFPFAFTYRDYVIEAFNNDKPYDQFLREQLAADLLGLDDGAAELAALGFLAGGPHANRNQTETQDDWIDVTTRGLMGLTAACARCHDHKYEPIPTADYYSLHGVFASIVRANPLAEGQLPLLTNYAVDDEQRADYERRRAAIDEKIAESRAKGDAQKIRETELAELLLFHPGAPARAMVVNERSRPVEPVIFIRGDAGSPGPAVPRRFLQILDDEQRPFSNDSSGRLELAEKIVARDNPLTARVFVNRVFGYVIGAHLVDTPSDFGLQGATPSHPELLDWLADDFMSHGWSTKRLVRQIVLSQTYQQASGRRAEMAAIDPENRLLWRANRKRLSIEAIRDSLLAVSGTLDRAMRGHASQLWGNDYTRRRAIYGYINRFNLDPTLRVFDYPSPMQTHGVRGESIVAPQALFAMNSRLVIDQATAIAETERFAACAGDTERVAALFHMILQRRPDASEAARVRRFVNEQRLAAESAADSPAQSRAAAPWPLVAQALLMSNEFQYVD